MLPCCIQLSYTHNISKAIINKLINILIAYQSVVDDKELPNLNSIGGLIDSWTYNSGRVHPNKISLTRFDMLIEKLLRGLICIKTKKHLIPLLLIDIHTPELFPTIAPYSK